MPDASTIDITRDTVLGGRVQLAQPARSYRVAIDPVLLAAAVPARPGDSVLELGSGVGAASLCLAARVPGCTVVGLELQASLVALATANATANGLAERVSFVTGDVADPPAAVAGRRFDHVLANPPHLAVGTATAPPDAGKAAAHIEGDAALALWLEAMLRLVKRKGTLTLIHRAERLADIIGGLRGRAGAMVVYPLWPRAGCAAKRILFAARRDVATPLRIAAGMALHGADGQFTPAAEAVLRDGRALDL
jgi:tRNA1(Val) A37 N6-methylase TrmN6